ncbi:hypothetical protein NEFER03_0197 [Nematocida sp. LUAm3]|nr:hypothetical protein NEFER03_0197 [Nematocida sp. LUAm3]KAI5173650.1 hypothetical protein NEFER02_0166 [Nematocida sp. LUAm2]KAI5176871.1 hypothetical protein NEFER01_0196 [Nematocida sp. LUAm1]
MNKNELIRRIRGILEKEGDPPGKEKKEEREKKEVSVLFKGIEIPLRVKSSSSVNDLILSTVSALRRMHIEGHPERKEIEKLVRDKETEEMLFLYEEGESTSLDRRCSIKRIKKRFLMVLSVKEEEKEEKEKEEESPVKKEDLKRTYKVTQPFLGLFSVEGILTADKESITLRKKSIFPKKEEILIISLNQIINVINIGKKSKIIFTDTSKEKSVKFLFLNREDLLDFSKFCSFFLLSS